MTEKQIVVGLLDSLEKTEDLKRKFVSYLAWAIEYFKELPLDTQKIMALKLEPLMIRDEKLRAAIGEFLEEARDGLNNMFGVKRDTFSSGSDSDVINIDIPED